MRGHAGMVRRMAATSSSASRAWITAGFPTAAARASWASKASRWAGRGASGRSGSPVPSRRPPTTRGIARACGEPRRPCRTSSAWRRADECRRWRRAGGSVAAKRQRPVGGLGRFADHDDASDARPPRPVPGPRPRSPSKAASARWQWVSTSSGTVRPWAGPRAVGHRPVAAGPAVFAAPACRLRGAAPSHVPARASAPGQRFSMPAAPARR